MLRFESFVCSNLFVAMIGITLTGGAADAGETCAGTSPRVCVERADLNSPGPIPDTHFTFEIVTDVDNPDVTFKTGSSTPWRVWSQVSSTDTTPANLGALTIESSGSDNFTVEIKNPNVCPGGICNPGAANLKSAVLNDTTSWSGNSSIGTGSSITGDLTENVQVIASSGGGALSLTIDGNAMGNITAPVVSFLTINGSVGAVSIIDIGLAPSGAYVTFGSSFAGDLVLRTDIFVNEHVDFNGVVGTTTEIDLGGHDIAGV